MIDEQRPFGVAILAAGRSSRMGRPKMLLPWQATTVLGHQIDLWNQAGAAQIALVVAADDAAMVSELERLGFAGKKRIVNPEPDRGMFSSIQCAASWTGWEGRLSHIAIALGDQPHLRLATLRLLLESVQKE